MSVALNIALPVVERDEFQRRVETMTGAPLSARTIDTMQVNIGLTCDLACRHCHVESSPKRTEQMDWPTMMLALHAASRARAKTIDITGGAPELNPHFRHLITMAHCRDLNVMVRTNLTIMLRAGFEDFPQFYAEYGVHLVASLPCYLPTNVDKQRGKRARLLRYRSSRLTPRFHRAIRAGHCWIGTAGFSALSRASSRARASKALVSPYLLRSQPASSPMSQIRHGRRFGHLVERHKEIKDDDDLRLNDGFPRPNACQSLTLA